MEVTILDANDNRYDPDVLNVQEEAHRFLIVVQHSERVSFSCGERVRLILASEAYEDRKPSEIVKRRKAMETVVGQCMTKLSEDTYCWEVENVSPVAAVLEAESHMSIFDFD